MPPSTPTTPKSQFDFIMQNGQPAKKGLKLPFPVPNLPKPLLIVIGLIGVFIIYSIASSALKNSGKPNYSSFTAAMTRAQEVSRVSAEVETFPQTSPATQNLASTANAVLTSWQGQLSGYLGGLGSPVVPANLTGDMSTATDSQMKNAASNDSLDTTFASYINTQLNAYDNELKAAALIAGPHGKALISQDLASVEVILGSLNTVINQSSN